MRPLDPLSGEPLASPVLRLLREAPAPEVIAELERLEATGLQGPAAAAHQYAAGALALREGRLDDALAALESSADAFAAAGEEEASALGRCEAWLAAIRRGPRNVYLEAMEALEELANKHAGSRPVWVTATHYRATAMRYAGHAEGTLRLLLDAFKASDGLLSERAQVLNSLGTLYVVLGAYGAANAVLAHAAELNHQIGDRVSEAISYGQLGSAALARGELETAKRHLQRQEFFASRVGDNFGQARALTLLGDMAIDLGRPDDAIELGERAREIASRVSPPLNMWIAYATRTIGRAKVDLRDKGAAVELAAALERFRKIGNQLGEALVSWDMAHLESATAKSSPGTAKDPRRAWYETAWKLATLGLTSRVTQVLMDLRKLVDDDAEGKALDMAIAAAGQTYPHLSTAQEVDLVLSEPDTVANIATRRIGGQRNLGRLAAHTLARDGLHVAVVAAGAIGTGLRPTPTRRSAATLLAQMPSLALWAWDGDTTPAEIARDLSSLRVALGEDSRVSLGWFPEARVVSVPFAGELGVDVTGVDLGPIMAATIAMASGIITLLPDTRWNPEAEALARMSGFATK